MTDQTLEYLKDIVGDIYLDSTILNNISFYIKEVIYDDDKEIVIFTYENDGIRGLRSAVTSLLQVKVGKKLIKYGMDIPFSVIIG